MNEPLFMNQSKSWLYHKFILSSKSGAYSDGPRKSAMIAVKKLFTNFVNYPRKYSSGQIALLIKRHEALLETILPIPSNPSYENSLAVLQKLIVAAELILKHYNIPL